GGARVLAIAVLQLFREDPLLEPVKELIAVGAEHAHLREMDVAVDEAGEDQVVREVRDLEAGVPPRHVGEGAEVLDGAVLDDKEPVADEAGRLLLAADVFPGVVEEVEERASDRTTAAGHRGDSSKVGGRRVNRLTPPGASSAGREVVSGRLSAE